MEKRKLQSHELAYLREIPEAFKPSVPMEVRSAAVAYARTLLERGFPVLFDQQHLAHVTGSSSQLIGIMRRGPSAFYVHFRIPKRGGGSRLITAPSPELKRVQYWIHRHVTSRFLHHPASHGFVPGRSIATNASVHLQASIVLKLDVRDFFGSVPRSTSYRAFRFAGYSQRIASLLAELTTLRNALPQGSPTSPALANYAAYRLDARLAAFAQKHEIAYTRYADDLTFSGEEFIPTHQRTIEHIMRDEGFIPHEAKVRYLLPDNRQSVTGVVVNERLNWPRDRRRWLRQEIYYLQRFGVDEHLRARGIEAGNYKDFIYGHVYALNSVRPDEARELLEALDRVSWPY